MEFTFTVRAEVERTQGKFAGRDELAQQLQDALEGADPGSLDGEGGGMYDVTSWSVDQEPQATKAPRTVRAPA